MLNNDLDAVYRALSDGGRRAMLERLSRGPASVSQLGEPLSMTLSAVVQHLAVLEEAGLVSSTKEGRVRTCRLRPEALSAAEQWIHQRRQLWERRFDRLEQALAELEEQEAKEQEPKPRTRKK